MRHPRRLVRRNRSWLFWLVALAVAGAIWGGVAPACAQHARESWSHTR